MLATLSVVSLLFAAAAEEPAVPDRRHEHVRHTDTVYTMPPYESLEQWQADAASIRKEILLGCGLYPLPEKTPLNANISGKIEKDGYSIEKVYFEAWPGFLVTGNLYRPFPLPDKKIPAVLCPHGHWERGRLQNDESCSVPGRSITLARMGATVLAIDMVGYNDSLQVEQHRFMTRADKLWGIHPFALQLWGSIRALDFLQSLPEVDPERLGCTGASGGGTQTFALYAVDDRVKAAAPVNMISCSMQGGCVCENAPVMRRHFSNLEIGATMAPRPMLMVSATGDWTRETPRVEYPSIRSIYALYGAEDKLEQVQVDAGHNYNKASREAMYRFFAKHLLGLEGYENFEEPAFEVEPDEAMRVFPDGELPEGFLQGDELMAHLRGLMQAEQAKRAASLSAEERAALLNVLLGTPKIKPEEERFTRIGRAEWEGYIREEWRAGSHANDEAVPFVFIHKPDASPQQLAIFVNAAEKSPWLDDAGAPVAAVREQLEAGHAAAIVDLYNAGANRNRETIRWAHGLGDGFADTFHRTAVGEMVRDIQLGHDWAMTRRDLSGPAGAFAADPLTKAVLRLAGFPASLIHGPEESLPASALENELYIPGYLTLFTPADAGLAD